MQSLYCLLWEDEFKGERVNEGDLDQQQQRELEEVLKQFPEVFQDIIGLPPKREIGMTKITLHVISMLLIYWIKWPQNN